MSVVPLIFRDWWDDIDQPMSRLMDQHFGSGINRDDLLTGLSSLGFSRPRSLFGAPTYYRPWRTLARSNSGGASTIHFDKDKFEIKDQNLTSDVWRMQIVSWKYKTRQAHPNSTSTTRKVILDVQQFSPDEITVKTIDSNIIVEARHEERKDEHGFISRQFVRRYVLPVSHDPLEVTSSLSSDGVLTINAPKKNITPAGKERIVNIVRTGAPASKSDETTHIITTEESE